MLRPSALPVVLSGPEVLFRLGEITLTDSVVRSSMPSGAWLHGEDHLPTAGSLGVLVDNVLGYALIDSAPEGSWSVSTAISLHVHPALAEAKELRAEAWTTQVDRSGGFAQGVVRAERGEVVAACSQRGRHVPAPAEGLGGPRPAHELGLDLDHDAVAALVGLRPAGVGSLELSVDERVTNPMRNLHGGIGLCAVDAAARVALAGTGDPVVPVSIETVYLRPLPLGGEARFEAEVVQRGRTLAVVDVVTTSGGRPTMRGRVTAQPR